MEIGFARVNHCADGRGSHYARAVSHDPFLPPFPSDPCGHVTLMRNAPVSFKDHCPGSRARSAHTPTQRTQTVQAGGGLGDPSSSPCLFSRGKETWMGSSWAGMGEKQGEERVCSEGERLGPCSRASTASQRDLGSHFGLGTQGTGGLYSSAGWPRATLGFALSSTVIP